jgi:hypothetical protein
VAERAGAHAAAEIRDIMPFTSDMARPPDPFTTTSATLAKTLPLGSSSGRQRHPEDQRPIGGIRARREPAERPSTKMLR